MYTILTGLQIIRDEQLLTDHAVVVKENLIHAIIPQAEIKLYLPATIREFPQDYFLAPGFIDLHIHGAKGHDVMDANVEGLAAISQTLAAEGVTRFLATTMTAEKSEIEAALKAVQKFMQNKDNIGARIVGVHLEGPFISPNKANAQAVDPILAPDQKLLAQWQKLAKGAIKLVTLAPERPQAYALIRYLKENNIVASIGHTDASYADTMTAIEQGSSHATHLFNAMRGMHHREPGALGALLMSDAVSAELIVDNNHLHPAMIELAWRVKGKDRLLLVTDAMRAKCMADGEYELGGQQVAVRDGCARLADGTLAGSALKIPRALQNMWRIIGCSLPELIRLVTTNPSRTLGLSQQLGTIAPGKAADLVVLNPELEVMLTMCEGRAVYAA